MPHSAFNVEHDLPEDILRAILLHGYYDEDPSSTPRHLYLQTLLAISPFFRRVARDTAELWSCICVHWQHPRIPDHFYHTSLELSKQRPLKLYVAAHQGRSIIEARRVFDLLKTHSKRWQSLVLLCPPWFFTNAKGETTLGEAVDVSNLKTLAIDLRDLGHRRVEPLIHSVIDNLKISPVLTTLQLDGLRACDWSALDHLAYQNVRNLTISARRNLPNALYLEGALRFASSLPNLERLNIFDFQIAAEQKGLEPECVLLPSLRHFVCYCNCDATIFLRFEAPLLESISIDGRCRVGLPDCILDRPSAYSPDHPAFPNLDTWIVDFQKGVRNTWGSPGPLEGGILDSLAQLSRQFTKIVFRDVPSAKLVEYLSQPATGRWPCPGAQSFSFCQSSSSDEEDLDMENTLHSLVNARSGAHRSYAKIGDENDSIPAPALLQYLRLSNVKISSETRLPLTNLVELSEGPEPLLSSSLSSFSDLRVFPDPLKAIPPPARKLSTGLEFSGLF